MLVNLKLQQIYLAYLIKYQDYSLKNAFFYLKSLRACARPNIGFFAQLIEYERFYKHTTSVEIIETIYQGCPIRMPDFYQKLFPDLFNAELNKQLAKSHTSIMNLQETKNYINRKRQYRDIQKDIDVVNDNNNRSKLTKD